MLIGPRRKRRSLAVLVAVLPLVWGMGAIGARTPEDAAPLEISALALACHDAVRERLPGSGIGFLGPQRTRQHANGATFASRLRREGASPAHFTCHAQLKSGRWVVGDVAIVAW